MNLSIFSRSFESSVTDPGYFSRIRIFPFRIRIFSSRIHIKENKYSKIVSKLSEIWSGLFIPDPDPDFLPIPDPGPGVKKASVPRSRGQKGTGSRIRNTVWKALIYILSLDRSHTYTHVYPVAYQIFNIHLWSFVKLTICWIVSWYTVHVNSAAQFFAHSTDLLVRTVFWFFHSLIY
jgi:hypothetical protein